MFPLPLLYVLGAAAVLLGAVWALRSRAKHRRLKRAARAYEQANARKVVDPEYRARIRRVVTRPAAGEPR